jgi:hypothetical protein
VSFCESVSPSPLYRDWSAVPNISAFHCCLCFEEHAVVSFPLIAMMPDLRPASQQEGLLFGMGCE